MSGIGGLDVSYGARHQIVRTNVAVLHTATTAVSEARANAALDLLEQGFGQTPLDPDFLYIGTDKTTGHYDSDNIFQVDTTGNGAVNATVVNKGGLLRDTRAVPLSRTAMAGVADANLVALGAAVNDTPLTGSMSIEAVLNVGVIEFTGNGTVNAGASAFGSLVAANENDATETAVANSDAEFAGQVYSTMLGGIASGLSASANYDIAGAPHLQAYTLDLSEAVGNLTENGMTDAGNAPLLAPLNIGGSANVLAVLDNHIESGRAQGGATTANAANFENLMTADSGAFANALGMVSVLSIGKVL